MAVPKRKVSKARRDKRRSSVWKLQLPGMTKCPKCGANRNEHPCNCLEGDDDNPFAALRDLF